PAQVQPALPQSPQPPAPAAVAPAPAAPAAAPTAPTATPPVSATPAQTGGTGTMLPPIDVRAPIIKRPAARVVAHQSPTVPPVSAAERLTEQQSSFDAARSNLFTTVGTT